MEEFIFYIIKLNLFVGGAVVAACILDRFLRRKYSVRWRYILWLCIAALLLVPVDLSKSYAVWEVQIPVQQTQTGNGETVLVKDGTYTGELQTDIQEAVVGTGETRASDEKDRFAENGDQGFRGIPSEWIFRGVFTVWIGGALLLAAWRSISFVAALKRLRRWSIPEVSEEVAALYEEVCRRYGKGRAPKLMVNEELSGPLLAGTFRTCLYLPDAVYTKRELRMIFAHELCHYYRRDLWYKMLLYAAATVYWFNPAMILLLREADRDLELLCDAQVTAGKSREYCLAYNRLLLKTAASSHGNLYYLSSSMNDGVADFKRRIVNIMGAKKLKRGLIPALLLSVTLVGVNALVGCTADSEEKKEDPADTEDVLEPEDENMAEAGMNENDPELGAGDGGLVSDTVTDEERLENMIPLFDSILTWNAESPEVSETHILQYRPDDPEYIWDLVWRAVYFAEYGVDGVTIDGPNKIVPASVAEAYARGLFSNLTSLPALESDFITYDAETDTYAIPAPDHSLSKTMIDGYQDGVNGSKLVTISLRRLRDPLYIVSRCVVRVVPNESNGASEFPFRISGIEKQFIPEIPEDYGEWEPMVPLFDSILTLNAESPETAATGEMQYLPDDPEYVWEAVYRGIVNFAEDGEYGVVEEEGEKTAPAELVLDYAKGLFCNLEELPDLGNVKNVKYDEESNTYVFAMSDHSQSVTTIESSEIQEDGTHLVTIALKTETTPRKIAVICTLQLKENKEPSLFPYRICGMLD